VPRKNNVLTLISRYRTELMGFAAVWILFYHEWRSLFGNSIVGKAERFVVEMGFYGVDIFLFLSGMGLVYAIGKQSLDKYYKRRYSRILVPFVITLCICAFDRDWDFAFFLKTLFGYHFWAVDIYTVLWFAYAIMTLYLLFPLYYHFFRKSSNHYLFTAVAVLIWLIASNGLDGIMRRDLYGFTNRIPVFLTGILVGELSKEGREIVLTGRRWICCAVMLVVGVACYYLTYYRKLFILVPSSECFLPDYLITLSGVCILSQLFSLLETRKPGQEILRALRFFGAMSLELYCVQDIMVGKIQNIMVWRFDPWAINVVNFWAITLGAYALHKLCAFLNRILKIR